MMIRFSKIMFTGILNIFLLASFANAQNSEKVLITNIEYDVSIYNEDIYGISDGSPFGDWWDGNIETSRRSVFQKAIIDKAISGKINVYDDAGKLLNTADVAPRLAYIDTLRYQQLIPPFGLYDTLIQSRILYWDIQYLRFREQWSYNPETFKITKMISEYAPVWVEYDKDGNRTGIRKALFWIKCDLKSKDSVTFTDLITYNSSIKSGIDLPIMKKPLYISNDTLNRKNYIGEITASAESGRIQIFDAYKVAAFYANEIDTLIPLTKSDAFSKFNFSDTAMLQKQFAPYDTYDTVIFDQFDRDKIYGFGFYEKWFLDKSTMAIKKEVLGLSAIIIEYNYDDKIQTVENYFYYPFEKPARSFELK